jgi:hypothetical protein
VFIVHKLLNLNENGVLLWMCMRARPFASTMLRRDSKDQLPMALSAQIGRETPDYCRLAEVYLPVCIRIQDKFESYFPYFLYTFFSFLCKEMCQFRCASLHRDPRCTYQCA